MNESCAVCGAEAGELHESWCECKPNCRVREGEKSDMRFDINRDDGGNEIRQFTTGATRDIDRGKLDPEGFLSPLVLERYAEYMHKHRLQSDGKLRDSDNWQRGIPEHVYIKSAWRHFLDWWMIHRGWQRNDKSDGHLITAEEALCGVIFNAMGYLHELLKSKLSGWKIGEKRHEKGE